VLGSGTPNPTPDRAGSGLAVVHGAAWVLVDCGRAVTQRALEAGLDLTALVAVFITHHHSDHLSDLATLAITRWTAGAGAPLAVIGPEGPVSRYATTCLEIYDDQSFHGQARARVGPRPSIAVQSFTPGAASSAVLDRDGWVVRSALVDHHPVAPAVGYRIERAGHVVTVSGDTAVCDGIRELAGGADVLVHEALLTAAVAPAALAWNAGAGPVGGLAVDAGVRRLVLTHLLPAPSSPADDDAFIAEARDGGYGGPIDVAHDGLRIAVPSGRPVVR